jgi:hypothetical protein
MTPFEYITVLVSIILGLGVTQIVTGVAHFLHSGNKVKIYWPHLLWIIMIFFFHIQEWWVFYEYKSFTAWQMHTFIFVILYPIGLFIQARLLFPFDNFDEVTDLKKFYYENYRIYYGSIGVQAILSIIDNMWLRGMAFNEQWAQVTICTLMFSVAIFKIRKEWVHRVLAVLLLLSIIVAIATNLDTWMIK